MKEMLSTVILCGPFCLTAVIADEAEDRAAVVDLVQTFFDAMTERDVQRFRDPQVLIHDRMAAVWTPYDLYVDGEFSHCGIDNFNFLKTEEGWKITGIVFSMELENCAESPLCPLPQ